MNKEEQLYNLFMEIIGKYNNKDIKKLIDSLIEYIENDKECE